MACACHPSDPMIDHAVYILNDLLMADPCAMNQLFQVAVSVNLAIADHPTAQVMRTDSRGDELRVIGLLNGILQTAGRVIAMEMSEDGQTLTGFKPIEIATCMPVKEPQQ